MYVEFAKLRDGESARVGIPLESRASVFSGLFCSASFLNDGKPIASPKKFLKAVCRWRRACLSEHRYFVQPCMGFLLFER